MIETNSTFRRNEDGATIRPSCRLCVLGSASWSRPCPFREVRYPEQSVLLRQGELASTVWFVKEGLVALSSVDDVGAELGCSVRAAGCLVGIEELLERPSPYTAWALTDVVVCSTSSETLANWVGHLESPMGAILRLGIEEASRRTAEQLALGGTSASRVARFLLHRCVSRDGLHPLDVSQRVMARMLAMTPETLSRTLARLRAKGAISSTRPVIVSDADALRAFAADDHA